MPEGDTIFRTARTLHRALAGKIVTRFESVLPLVTRVAEDYPVIGRQVESVVARGKHLLMVFSGDLTLHTHMRMNGSWHIYRIGERWQRPARDMRVVVGTADFVAVGFNVPIAELLSKRDVARHKELRALGPDLIGVGTAEAVPNEQDDDDDTLSANIEIVRRLRARANDFIGDALLNQRVVAGIGNVLKSEILFVAGVDPFRPVGSFSEDELTRIVDVARELMRANVLGRSETLSPTIGRRTTRSLSGTGLRRGRGDLSPKLWVYARDGKLCRRCGTRIESRKTGIDARLTYWCPVCQR